VFALGSPFGSSIGIFLGGWIATRFDWRVAFVAVGLAGIAFAPVFRLVVRDPPRPPALGAAGAAGAAPAGTASGHSALALRDAWRVLSRTAAFWWLSLAAAVTSLVGYGLLFWLPSFFTRSHGLALLEASRVFGAIVLVGGIAGPWAGGWLGDRLGSRSRRWYALAPAIALSTAAPLYVVGVLSGSLQVALATFVVAHAFGMAWIGPATAALQHVVPSTMRATASASYLFVLNLVGIGGGTLFFGFVSDILAPRMGADSLRYSILIGLAFYFVAAALFVAASRRLEEAWRD
jgi:sugar phosphate permease